MKHTLSSLFPLLLSFMGMGMGLVITTPAAAQNNEHRQTVTSSIPNKDAKFLLFPTRNNFNFLKLNTRNGEVDIVQFSLDDSKTQFESRLESDEYPLVSKEEESNGRFYLYPTTNIFNFLLMDQIDGRVWQLQWHFDSDKQFISRIEKVLTYKEINKVANETTYFADLEYKNNIYYKRGIPFTGSAYSNDMMMIVFMYQGVLSRVGVYHFNKNTVAFSFEKESNIPDDISAFYDDYGNPITKEEFLEKYPALIRIAKEFAKSLKQN